MKDIETQAKRPHSSNLRFAAYVWTALSVISFCMPVPEAYVAMYVIIAAIFSVGSEILKGLGR